MKVNVKDFYGSLIYQFKGKTNDIVEMSETPNIESQRPFSNSAKDTNIMSDARHMKNHA